MPACSAKRSNLSVNVTSVAGGPNAPPASRRATWTA
jgi:hypothetical protein